MRNYFDTRIYGLLLAVLMGLVIIMVFGCSSEKQRTKRIAKCEKWQVCGGGTDTIIKQSVKIDTVVTDNSELWLNILFECDSTGAVLIRSIDSLNAVNTNLRFAMTNGQMTLVANVPPKVIPCKPCIEKTTVVSKPAVMVAADLKWYDKFFIVMGKIFTFALIIVAVALFLWLRFRRYVNIKNP